MRQIKCATGDKHLLVDDDLYDALSAYKWYLNDKGYGFARIGPPPLSRNKLVAIHRYVMRAKRGQIIDHIDRNPLNNQRSNLRFVSWSQNSMNRPARNTRSGYKGVCWVDGRWIVQVYLHKKRLHKSTHTDLVEAAKTYDDVAKRIFGEYALLNFPPGTTPPTTYDNYPTWAKELDRKRLARFRTRYHTDSAMRQKIQEKVRSASKERYWRDIEKSRAYNKAKSARYRNRNKGTKLLSDL